MEKASMIKALNAFKKAYLNLVGMWEDFDLNDLESIEFYPFDKSFDELNVEEWVDETILEIKEIDE